MARVKEVFAVTGLGAVVVLDGTSALPINEALDAIIERPDGSRISAEAWKEWILRRIPTPVEIEAFRLKNLAPVDVPLGSEVTIGRKRQFGRQGGKS